MPTVLRIRFAQENNTLANVSSLEETMIPYFLHLGVGMIASNFNHINPDQMICYDGPLSRKAKEFLDYLKKEGLQIELEDYQPKELQF